MWSTPNALGADEIGPYWSDEEVIMRLESIQNGSPEASLPKDVVADVNPYLIKPENLPDGIWYVHYWKDPKQADVGLWKVKGDPCQIYSNSLIIGWRTTLEFYEGHSPSGHRTDWVMQDYSISDKGSSKFKGGSSLCQVFRSARQSEPKKPEERQTNVADNVSGASVNNILHAEAAEMENLHLQAMLLYQGDNLHHAECFAEGDFLELQDLDEPQSSSSSSDNSSCVSSSSDLYFESDALLRELDDEPYPTKSSSTKLIISRPNDMVITVAAQGPPLSDNNKTLKPVKVQASAPPASVETGLPDKPQIPKEDAKALPNSATNNVGPSTSKGKKARRGKTIKKFCCLGAF